MDATEIESQKQTIISQYGPWTAHNIHLGGGVYTMRNEIVGDEIKLRRVVQTISDLAKRPLRELRILDLACLEGLYAVEFALHGARVLGIEGREANIEKARFAKEALALDRLELALDDVRNLSLEQHGAFDVVLCLGILYHLDAPDLIPFLEKIYSVCMGFVVIDTHLSMKPKRSFVLNGKKYWGRVFKEHSRRSSAEVRLRAPWSSLDNPTSFWFTRESLFDALTAIGFTSVVECHVPFEPDKPRDRVTFVAMKGENEVVRSSPDLNEYH